MSRNRFEGVIEDWKYEVMLRRARRMGFRGEDLEDALQELALEVMAFVFDPVRAGARKEATVLTELVDCRLLDMRRSRKRALRRDEAAGRERQRDQVNFEAEERISSEAEINIFSRCLLPFDQTVLKYLKEGKTVVDIAKKLDCRWHTVAKAVGRIEEEMRLRGMVPPGYSESV